MTGEKIRLRQAVLVEGKYDKIRLEPLLDALILPVGGYRVYRDPELRALIRALAGRCGVILLTDSDSAGFRIRGYLGGMLPKEQVTHVYIPDRYGKERRKRRPSGEGKLGVEGISPDELRDAFARAGVLECREENPDPITRLDLYEDGLSGGASSRQLRLRLLGELGLPQRLNQNAMLGVLNQMLTRAQYRALVERLKTPRE